MRYGISKSRACAHAFSSLSYNFTRASYHRNDTKFITPAKLHTWTQILVVSHTRERIEIREVETFGELTVPPFSRSPTVANYAKCWSLKYSGSASFFSSRFNERVNCDLIVSQWHQPCRLCAHVTRVRPCSARGSFNDPREIIKLLESQRTHKVANETRLVGEIWFRLTSGRFAYRMCKEQRVWHNYCVSLAASKTELLWNARYRKPSNDPICLTF